MEIVYTPDALEDLKFWKKSGDKNIQKKIDSLITAIIENPYSGIGRPEQLKHELSGFWSRRITGEHRIIYQIFEENNVTILEIQSLRGHY